MNETSERQVAPALALVVSVTDRSRSAVKAQVRDRLTVAGGRDHHDPGPGWGAFLDHVAELSGALGLSTAQASGVVRAVERARTTTPPDARMVQALRSVVDDAAAEVRERGAPPVEVDVPGHLPEEQRASWSALLEVARVMPSGWTVVGGQMVAMHCWERGAQPSRPTHDADAVLDVRAHRDVLRTYTAHLVRFGFEARGLNDLSEHQHRWIRPSDGAQLDVLLPDGAGARARATTGVTGSTTIATPGGEDALAHSRPARVRLGDSEGIVNRPHLAGALLVKARAASNPFDGNPRRHLQDAAVLAGLIGGSSDADVLRRTAQNPKHRTTLARLLERMAADPSIWSGARPTGGTPGRTSVVRGLAVLRSLVGEPEVPGP